MKAVWQCGGTSQRNENDENNAEISVEKSDNLINMQAYNLTIFKLRGGSVHWRMNRWQTKKMSQKNAADWLNLLFAFGIVPGHWAGGWLCVVWQYTARPI